jgi:hypothetical protein
MIVMMMMTDAYRQTDIERKSRGRDVNKCMQPPHKQPIQTRAKTTGDDYTNTFGLWFEDLT